MHTLPALPLPLPRLLPCLMPCHVPTCPAPFYLQECLRDARRVESITGQQDDRDNYVVPVRCVRYACCAVPAVLCLLWSCFASQPGQPLPPPLPFPPPCPAFTTDPCLPAPLPLSPHRALPSQLIRALPCCACPAVCRQLEERCRDMDIFDLQPFYASPAFGEAGFRLAQGGQQVLLARS